MNDFGALWSSSRDSVLAAVDRVGGSGRWILGDEVVAFEHALATACGLPFAVGCASGLDAIEIALRCLGIEAGDRVLSTPLSAFATTLAILRAGGRPTFVDVDHSGQLDLEQVETAIDANRDIRFLLPVHLYGHALDLGRLARLAERFDLLVVEDCAQAIGAASKGVPVGTVGEIAITSFYPTKNIGAMGDGGALLTSTASLAAHARSLRDYGQLGKYEHTNVGLNSRLDEVHAAILRDAFLPRLSEFTKRRREVADRYSKEIENPALAAVPPPEGSESVWHLYPILVSTDRAGFRAHLEEHAVQSAVHYPTTIPAQQALARAGGVDLLAPTTRALEFAAREVSLPIHPFLTELDIDRVVAACNRWRG
jgi:dTDP-3-amino-3,4,6-trideoxy-alpha-D-glucose transaminase